MITGTCLTTCILDEFVIRAETLATWSISLDVTCPECEHDFNLLSELIDDGSPIEPLECSTARTNNYETVCPECKHEFGVCFEY